MRNGIFSTFSIDGGIFWKILSFMQNIDLDMNNVMNQPNLMDQLVVTRTPTSKDG